MSYLLDKQARKKRIIKICAGIFVLFVLLYFQSGIFTPFSKLASFIFRPFFSVGNSAGGGLSFFGSFFNSKSALIFENQNLRNDLDSARAKLANHDAILSENESLKESLGRKKENDELILAAVLSKPNRSPYDTMILDIGTGDGVKVGDMVFALGNIPIGKVAEVFGNTSKVVLFSTSGEKTEVILSDENDIFIEALGRGGGNFEISLMRDIKLQKGEEVILPGITPYVVATVSETISEERDSFQKVLLTSPVNIFELKFVEVKR